MRTMSECSKFAQVVNEMRRYKLDKLCISECKWTVDQKYFQLERK